MSQSHHTIHLRDRRQSHDCNSNLTHTEPSTEPKKIRVPLILNPIFQESFRSASTNRDSACLSRNFGLYKIKSTKTKNSIKRTFVILQLDWIKAKLSRVVT